jgi:hypothetical protein
MAFGLKIAHGGLATVDRDALDETRDGVFVSGADIAQLTAPTMQLRRFVAEGWKEVEPEIDFIPSYHVDAICEHLEAVAAVTSTG